MSGREQGRLEKKAWTLSLLRPSQDPHPSQVQVCMMRGTVPLILRSSFIFGFSANSSCYRERSVNELIQLPRA